MEDIEKRIEIEALLLAGHYLTGEQAALYLGVTQKTLADYRYTGRKPDFIKVRNQIRYPAQAIIEFLVQRMVAKELTKYDHLLSATLEPDT